MNPGAPPCARCSSGLRHRRRLAPASRGRDARFSTTPTPQKEKRIRSFAIHQERPNTEAIAYESWDQLWRHVARYILELNRQSDCKSTKKAAAESSAKKLSPT